MQQQANEQICGVVESITFQNPENGFAVVQITGPDGEQIDVVGPLAGCVPGETLTLAGRYVNHSQYGMQFEATACIYEMPAYEGDIYKYLASGALPGIGPATAKRIVQQFGDNALNLLANEPEKLAEVRGFSQSKARLASERFNEMYAVREAMSALARFGLSAAEAVAIYRRYGRFTADILESNPYRLCGEPLYISFARADAIAGHLGLEQESPERAQAALLYTLRHNLQNGHTCLPYARLLDTAGSFFGLSLLQLEQQMAALSESGQIRYANVGECYVYMADMLEAEFGPAQRIRDMAKAQYLPPGGVDKLISIREQMEGIRYAPLQKQAIVGALTHGAMLITGGPGTGKTTAVNAIIALLEQQAERVGLAAPTGRAAKRLTELTGRKASTIHRLLEAGYVPGSSAATFARGPGNPLRYDVLVVDEMSMVDAQLFSSLVAALKPGARLVMVGDADQLPSVGAGNVLAGLVESGVVPVVALTEVFRQAAQSLIVSNAHRIVKGELPVKGGKEDDYFFLRSKSLACQQLVCELMARRLPESYGFAPIGDIQVLCPGRKGVLGCETLNPLLQQLLNPPTPDKPEIVHGNTAYRLGDKVMQVKNNYDLPFTRTDGEPGAGAFNGDIGVIEEISRKNGSVTVLCEDRHVYYTLETLHELELAYAMTIHKSQGSEFEAVVIPLSDTPTRLRYRNLLYTAVTRAKRLCVLAGEDEILVHMVHNNRQNIRYSCFAVFLRGEGGA